MALGKWQSGPCAGPSLHRPRTRYFLCPSLPYCHYLYSHFTFLVPRVTEGFNRRAWQRRQTYWKSHTLHPSRALGESKMAGVSGPTMHCANAAQAPGRLRFIHTMLEVAFLSPSLNLQLGPHWNLTSQRNGLIA